MQSVAVTLKTFSCGHERFSNEGFHAPDDAYVCLLPIWQMMGSITRAAGVVCYKCTTQNRCAAYYISMQCKEAGWANGRWSKQLSSYPLRDMQPTNRLAWSSLSMAL